MLRKTALILFLTLFFALNFFAQDDVGLTEKENSKIPIKVDEFGRVGNCDLNARVYNFFIELNNNPSVAGYIILYQGKDVLPAEYDSNLMEKRIRNEITFVKLDGNRITFVRGGFRNEVATELYLVPNGAIPPEPTDTIPAPTSPKDKTFLYDNNILLSDDNYDFLDKFILPTVQAKIDEENRLAEEESKTEELNSESPIEPETETVEENLEVEKPTPQEIEEAKFFWVNEKFGAILKEQKDTKGVIIFYADDAYYEVGKLQNLIEEGKQKIAEANKISIDKIQVVYGGYRENVQAEFWIVPKKGEFPPPKPVEKPIKEIEK